MFPIMMMMMMMSTMAVVNRQQAPFGAILAILSGSRVEMLEILERSSSQNQSTLWEWLLRQQAPFGAILANPLSWVWELEVEVSYSPIDLIFSINMAQLELQILSKATRTILLMTMLMTTLQHRVPFR